MLYNPPTGALTANDPYVGKNVGAGIQGSRVPPAAIEYTQRELVAIIAETLMTPTNDDLKQVLKVMRSGQLWTFSDSSITPNRIEINPKTAHTVLFKGLPFRVFPAFTNDSPTVKIAVSGIEFFLLRRDGTPLQAKDVVQNTPLDVVSDGTAFRLMGFAASEVSRNVPSPMLYVRGTTGNDQTTDGLTDAPGKAFKTLDAALLAAQRFNYGASQLAIILSQSEPQTYAAPQTAGSLGTTQSRLGSAGSILIQGGNGVDNQDSFVISGLGFSGNTGIIHPSFGTNLVLKNLRADNQNPTGFNTITCSSNATIAMQNVTLSGLNSTSGLQAHLYAADGGRIRVLDGCKVTSGMPSLYRALASSITQTGIMKVIGALSFANAVLVADTSGGSIQFPGGSFDLSQGSFSGTRYQANNNATIQTFGQGLQIIPGNSGSGGTSNNGTAV